MKKRLIEELELDLIEVRAYRDLQGVPFDFGTGLISDDSKESEDVYYKIRERNIEEKIEYLKSDYYFENEKNEENEEGKDKKRTSKDRRISNIKAKRKQEKLYNKGAYFIYEKENEDTGDIYLSTFSLSKRKGRAKRESNKKVRKAVKFPRKGNGYRKVYNYELEVY